MELECFEVKLLLRQKQQSNDQGYPRHLFEHLGLCRNCWAYAHYLWHKEAEELCDLTDLSPEAVETRLEQAWAMKNQNRAPAA